jgi:hypothetical protein
VACPLRIRQERRSARGVRGAAANLKVACEFNSGVAGLYRASAMPGSECLASNRRVVIAALASCAAIIVVVPEHREAVKPASDAHRDG